MTRSGRKWSIGFSVMLFAVALGNIPLAGIMDRLKPAIWIQVLYGLAFFGFLLGCIPLLAWITKRQQKQFGMICPNCGKPLVGVSSQIVVATGNCGRCGERVFTETHSG